MAYLSRNGYSVDEVSRSERKRIGASLAITLWVVGFELLPLAHVAGHEALASHTHGDDGARVDDFARGVRAALSRLSVSGEDEAAVAHRRAHRDGVEHHGEVDDAEGVHSPHHGAHSLAHRGVAAANSPMAPPAPAPARLAAPLASAFVADAEVARLAPSPASRGPPRSS